MATDRFTKWCDGIADRVAAMEPALQYAHESARGGEPGDFRDQGRFVHLSSFSEDRALISGMAPVVDPIRPGGKMPHAPVLFPGGLAVTIPLSDDGAQLAARAIVVWLGCKDEELDNVRAEFRRYRPYEGEGTWD